MIKRDLALLAALTPLWAAAQGPALAGRMGDKALVVIDGQPRMLSVGQTAQGVKLLRWDGDDALVEQDGVPSRLRAGAAPAVVGGGVPDSRGREVVIAAGPGGHFVTGGLIDGHAVRFMVDTGATLVALSRAEAERIGIDWRHGRSVATQTANGATPAALVTLNTLRVGDIELANVAAIVVPANMPNVLLGNSFLSRLQMRRENDLMRLELK